MKNTVYILLSLIMGLSGCSSQKKLETSTPFVLGPAICQEWYAGKEESGSGQVLKITINEMSSEEVNLQNVYFRGAMSKVNMEMEDKGMMAVARFKKEGKKDMVMHADSTKEVGNQPPKLRSKEEMEFPFELKRDEAVLSYLEDDKVKYVKIIGVVEKPARILPSRPEN